MLEIVLLIHEVLNLIRGAGMTKDVIVRRREEVRRINAKCELGSKGRITREAASNRFVSRKLRIYGAMDGVIALLYCDEVSQPVESRFIRRHAQEKLRDRQSCCAIGRIVVSLNSHFFFLSPYRPPGW